MTPNPRQSDLLEEVRARGSVSVEALAERFGVTLQTVRRDVKLLSDEGLLARFHGGVRVPSSTTENIAYRQREMLNAEGKQGIARAVAARIPNGSSMLINLGTTTEAVARELSEDSNRATGGVIGMRTAERLPDVFVATVRSLKSGDVAPELLRTGAGFHLLKLVEKREGEAFRMQQTRARHILLRPSAQLSAEAAQRRLAGASHRRMRPLRSRSPLAARSRASRRLRCDPARGGECPGAGARRSRPPVGRGPGLRTRTRSSP